MELWRDYAKCKSFRASSTYLSDYKIHLSNQDKSVIKGSFKISGKRKAGEKVTLSIPELDIHRQIEVGESGESDFILNKQPELWSPETPKLYEVEFEYNGETIKDSIGFRTVEVDGADIKLNGKPMYLRGISLHEESPLTKGEHGVKKMHDYCLVGQRSLVAILFA